MIGGFDRRSRRENMREVLLGGVGKRRGNAACSSGQGIRMEN